MLKFFRKIMPSAAENASFKMNLIVAVSEDMGIGKNNALPWHLPKEFKYFQDKTTKTENPEKVNAVILGRKCWESIPPKFRPLKNRINVVISSTLKDVPDGAFLCRSFEEACSILSTPPLSDKVETVWNVGGREIYKLGLQSPYFTRLYITRLLQNFDCDVYFPDVDFSKLRKVRLPNVPDDIQEEGNIRYRFEVYEKGDQEEK